MLAWLGSFKRIIIRYRSIMTELNEGRSIEDYSHAHPYEYLTKMNQVFTSYNRVNTKDYSSVSKMKLPFKKFNHMKVPEAFC